MDKMNLAAQQQLLNFVAQQQITRNGQSTAAANVASLKTKSELRGGDEPEKAVAKHTEEPTETFISSATSTPDQTTEQQAMQSAENSGDLSQVDPQLKNTDQRKVEAGREHQLHMAEEERNQQTKETDKTQETSEAVYAGKAKDEGFTEEQLIENALRDLPADIKKASKDIVMGQFKGPKAAPSLAKLHNIPDLGTLEVAPEALHDEPLDIHDATTQPNENNKPLLRDFEGDPPEEAA